MVLNRVSSDYTKTCSLFPGSLVARNGGKWKSALLSVLSGNLGFLNNSLSIPNGSIRRHCSFDHCFDATSLLRH